MAPNGRSCAPTQRPGNAPGPEPDSVAAQMLAQRITQHTASGQQPCRLPAMRCCKPPKMSPAGLRCSGPEYGGRFAASRYGSSEMTYPAVTDLSTSSSLQSARERAHQTWQSPNAANARPLREWCASWRKCSRKLPPSLTGHAWKHCAGPIPKCQCMDPDDWRIFFAKTPLPGVSSWAAPQARVWPSWSGLLPSEGPPGGDRDPGPLEPPASDAPIIQPRSGMPGHPTAQTLDPPGCS